MAAELKETSESGGLFVDRTPAAADDGSANGLIETESVSEAGDEDMKGFQFDDEVLDGSSVDSCSDSRGEGGSGA